MFIISECKFCSTKFNQTQYKILMKTNEIVKTTQPNKEYL